MKYNRRMRSGLFVISFVCLFCGFGEVAYDFQYIKEI